MSDCPKIDAKTLEEDGFHSENPPFKCLVVEDKNSPGQLIGYTLYYFGYAVWAGKSLYLEDIMVTEKYRGAGVGSNLFSKMCQIALDEQCNVMHFVVLNWNPAIKFYEKFGVEDYTKKQAWHYFYMPKEKIIEGTRKFK